MPRRMQGFLAVCLSAGWLAWLGGSAVANGELAHDPNVRVFYPTPIIDESDGDHREPQVVVNKVVVNVFVDALALDRDYRAALGWERRKDAIRRAMGQRYTGFIKMYRGPRYPF